MEANRESARRSKQRQKAASDVLGGGLHSSTSQLNVSTFCGTRLVPSIDMWVITGHKLD
jgi:hypothetical protein